MTFLTELYATVLPLLLSAIAAWLARALITAAGEAKRRWGIEIEARHREALHSALMSGITAALNRGLAGQQAVDAAISYAARSVPDALAKLEPDAAVLAELTVAKLRLAQPPLITLESSLPAYVAPSIRGN